MLTGLAIVPGIRLHWRSINQATSMRLAMGPWRERRSRTHPGMGHRQIFDQRESSLGAISYRRSGLDSWVADIQLDSEKNPLVLGTTSNSLATLTQQYDGSEIQSSRRNPVGKRLRCPQEFSGFGQFRDSLGSKVYATSLTNPLEGITTPLGSTSFNCARTVETDVGVAPLLNVNSQ